MNRYSKKPGQTITAVQLKLDMETLRYKKWGGQQECKPGDWIVDNEGEVYTIDRESFAATYVEVSPGVYTKTGYVWAEQATKAGSVKTKEGVSEYGADDYIVSNNEDGSDSYCVGASKFEEMYQIVSTGC